MRLRLTIEPRQIPDPRLDDGRDDGCLSDCGRGTLRQQIHRDETEQQQHRSRRTTAARALACRRKRQEGLQFAERDEPPGNPSNALTGIVYRRCRRPW